MGRGGERGGFLVFGLFWFGNTTCRYLYEVLCTDQQTIPRTPFFHCSPTFPCESPPRARVEESTSIYV